MAFSIIQNHPFVDGNKRTGHAAMETFLLLNGLEIHAPWMSKNTSFCRLPLDNWGAITWRLGFAITPDRGMLSKESDA